MSARMTVGAVSVVAWRWTQHSDGVLTDLGSVRSADENALLRYCYQVAGTGTAPWLAGHPFNRLATVRGR